ncbi:MULTISPECIES: AraC family transcriptional regulator [unclassified Streptomyces]|uniref:AraC family transcriptional regulator n=1 Tax=unclassified Streptomyces TaxID=2593676 RepID=UPI000689F8BB|nr:AraC family transcriptional regulator [Streptomyces sp. NRRL F-5727]
MCQPAWAAARTEAVRLQALRTLRRVRDRIDREYTRPLDVPALARTAGLPAGTLHRAFTQAYGMTPHAFVTTLRTARGRTA